MDRIPSSGGGRSRPSYRTRPGSRSRVQRDAPQPDSALALSFPHYLSTDDLSRHPPSQPLLRQRELLDEQSGSARGVFFMPSGGPTRPPSPSRMLRCPFPSRARTNRSANE